MEWLRDLLALFQSLFSAGIEFKAIIGVFSVGCIFSVLMYMYRKLTGVYFDE